MSKNLTTRLLYLDRDFIAGTYEESTGESPTTQISRNEGMNAGSNIPFFSAGVSTGENKTYNLSSLGMLTKILDSLQKLPTIQKPDVQLSKPSVTGWVTGTLSVHRLDLKRSGKEHDQLSYNRYGNAVINPVIASETYFSIYNTDKSLKLALITTPDYFSSGIDALTKLYGTVSEKTEMPVTALVRIIASVSTFEEWITIPLVILEPAGNVELPNQVELREEPAFKFFIRRVRALF